jgi:hypothetical protein
MSWSDCFCDSLGAEQSKLALLAAAKPILRVDWRQEKTRGDTNKSGYEPVEASICHICSHRALACNNSKVASHFCSFVLFDFCGHRFKNF